MALRHPIIDIKRNFTRVGFYDKITRSAVYFFKLIKLRILEKFLFLNKIYLKILVNEVPL